MASAEHEAIVKAIDCVLQEIDASALIGVRESQRRTFDYSCLLKRDLGRPLVAQVLWQHEHGIEKDLRTLLLDTESAIKLYVLRESTRVRATLDDVLVSYRRDPQMRERLLGLRLVFVPSDFDADQERDQAWLRAFLASSFSKDIAFGILFGGLTKHVFDIFVSHNGPYGLKYAILHEITENGLAHMPTFKERIGYKANGPIREALTMLNATGLIRNWPKSNCYFPTIRCRFVLDFSRRLLLDLRESAGWSSPTRALFEALGLELPSFHQVGFDRSMVMASDPFASNLLHTQYCESQFGRDLLAGVDLSRAVLHSDFLVDGFIHQMRDVRGFTFEFFAEPEYLFFPKGRQRNGANRASDGRSPGS